MNVLSSRLLLVRVRVRLSLSCPPGRQAGTIPTTSITDHVSKRKRRPSSSGSGGCTTDENPRSVAQLCHPPHPAIIRRAEKHNFFSFFLSVQLTFHVLSTKSTDQVLSMPSGLSQHAMQTVSVTVLSNRDSCAQEIYENDSQRKL